MQSGTLELARALDQSKNNTLLVEVVGGWIFAEVVAIPFDAMPKRKS